MITGLQSRFMHFIETDGALSDEEHQILEQLLRYGPADAVSEC